MLNSWVLYLEEADSFMNRMGFIDSDISGLRFVVRAVLNPADDIQMTVVDFDVDKTSESFTNTEFNDAHDNMIDDGDDIDDIAADDCSCS